MTITTKQWNDYYVAKRKYDNAQITNKSLQSRIDALTNDNINLNNKVDRLNKACTSIQNELKFLEEVLKKMMSAEQQYYQGKNEEEFESNLASLRFASTQYMRLVDSYPGNLIWQIKLKISALNAQITENNTAITIAKGGITYPLYPTYPKE